MDRFPPWCTAFFTNTLPIFTKFYEELERSLTSYKIDRTLDVRCYGTVYVDAGIIYYVYVHVHVRNILSLALVYSFIGWRARLARAVDKGKPLRCG